MKKGIMRIWATICMFLASTVGMLWVHATEQEVTTMAEQTDQASKIFLTLDVLQTVSLVIIVVAALTLFAFYVAKAVLKRMHVEPEKKERDTHNK